MSSLTAQRLIQRPTEAIPAIHSAKTTALSMCKKTVFSLKAVTQRYKAMRMQIQILPQYASEA